MNRLALALLVVACSAIAQSAPKYQPFPDAQKMFAEFELAIPQQGLISDENTAKAIGKALLEAKFGAKLISKGGPIEVRREGDYWVVETRTSDFPPMSFGGSYAVVIAKRDGRILYLSESK